MSFTAHDAFEVMRLTFLGILVCTDQILLLIMEYELKRHGIIIPWDAIAKRLASEKDTTGACVQQHLSKLRKEMLARGSWVPPLSGKPKSKQQQSDIRGIVMVKKRDGEYETREISWTEDAFKYVDLVHINNAKTIQYKKASDDGEDVPGSAASPLKTKRSASDVLDEVDPADLPSDEDFDPSNKKSKKAKRVTRASTKSAGKPNSDSYGAESDAGNNSHFDDSEKMGAPRKPVMMTLFQSEEDDLLAGRVILEVPQHFLAQYPEGVNEAYRNTHGIQTGNTDKEGEEVFDDNVSDSGPVRVANTAQNDAEAFGGDPEYSIMDANTAENYADAFGGGYGQGAYYDDSDSDFEEQQVSTAIPNANAHLTQSSHQVTGFANSFGDIFDPALHPNNQHAGHGNFVGMNTPASTPLRHISGQSAYGHNAAGPNAMRLNLLSRNRFNSNARVQDFFNGGPVNRPATGNFMGQSTFAQMIAGRNALGGGRGIGLGHGTSVSDGFVMGYTTTSVNDPFVSNEDKPNNQFGGTQTGIISNPSIPAIIAENNPIDLNDTDLPMNDSGVDGSNGNGGDRTSGSYDAQLQAQSHLDTFDVSEHLLLTSGRLLITCSFTLTSNVTSDLNIE